MYRNLVKAFLLHVNMCLQFSLLCIIVGLQGRISPAGIREFPGGPVQRFTGLPQN